MKINEQFRFRCRRGAARCAICLVLVEILSAAAHLYEKLHLKRFAISWWPGGWPSRSLTYCKPWGSLNVIVVAVLRKQRRTVTRNLWGYEIANVNFFTTTSSTTFTQCAREATEFGEITQNNGHYPVEGHQFWYQSTAHIDFLSVINTNLPPILRRFWDRAFDRSKIVYLATPLAFNALDGRVPDIIPS